MKFKVSPRIQTRSPLVSLLSQINPVHIFPVSWRYVTRISDYRRDFELDLLTTPNIRLMTTLNYSAIADLHNLQITRANDEYFPSAVSSPAVPW
jgi:hypothetical protein